MTGRSRELILEDAKALDEALQCLRQMREKVDLLAAMFIEPSETDERAWWLLLLARALPTAEEERVRLLGEIGGERVRVVAYTPSELRVRLAAGDPLVARARSGRPDARVYFLRGEGRFYAALGDLNPASDSGEGMRIASQAAARLREQYGPRLSTVVFHGSWVQGEAHEQSDVDLLLVLDRVGERREEHERLREVLSPLRHGPHPVDAVIVTERQWRTGDQRFYQKTRREGVLL